MAVTPDSSSMDDMNAKDLAIMLENSDELPITAVLGTGMYGRALAARLRATRHFQVRVGSRTRSDTTVTPVEAVTDASIVFLAVPAHAHEAVLNMIGSHLAQGVIIVDVSNHPLSIPPTVSGSLAAQVQSLAPPGVIVAKAFNTLSSYHIEPQGAVKSFPVVHIACDSKEAVNRLSNVVVKMGLTPVHHGDLSTAEELERNPHRLFPTWRSSLYLGLIVFVWWVLYATLASFVIKTRGREPGTTRTTDWEKWPMRVFMSCTAETSMTLFALTFLPGPIAGLIQLARGSASKPFGRFFGHWLGMRKELGVVAFFYASMHACAGAISKSHFDNSGWKGYAYFVVGIISYALFTLLAISSSRSVSDNMSWAEFRAVFSWVGTAALITGVLHQGLWGWIIHKHRPTPASWPGFGKVMPIYWLGIILPLVAIALRAITWSPCAVFPLRRLRNEIAVQTKSI